MRKAMVKPESKTLIASTVDHIFVPLSWSQDSLQQSALHSYLHHLKASHSTTDLVTSLSPWGVRGQGGAGIATMCLYRRVTVKPLTAD